MSSARRMVVIGHGMVGQRLVEEMRSRDRAGAWRITVLGEEEHSAYDRVALSSRLSTGDTTGLGLVGPALARDPLVDFLRPARVVRVDRGERIVLTAEGRRYPYDTLVLATGARAVRPPVPGADLPGCFVHRTLDDLAAIREAAVAARAVVVIGGGLLGLETAGALHRPGRTTGVIEAAPHLMPAQLDPVGSALLAGRLRLLGLNVRCGVPVKALEAGPNGRVARVVLRDGSRLPADLVVFAIGVRPRDELAGTESLPRGPRGGFLVDDRCRTVDPWVRAIGDCAALEGRCHGLVGPGYRMAEVVARQLLGDSTARYEGMETSTRLKMAGVEVAGSGTPSAGADGMEFSLTDTPREGDPPRYAKLVLDPTGRILRGVVLVGDVGPHPLLRSLLGQELPASCERLLRTGV